jgi:ADP-ribose pyrophosphatase YjhB (NUDIX family)
MTRELFELADEIRAIASTGLHYAENEFDRDRYQRLMAVAARLVTLQGNGDATEAIEQLLLEADRGYVTPKVDVRMAVFREDRVLLVRERVDGRWAMPGGWADIGDSPSDAAVRETVEEAGVEVRAVRLAGIFDYRLQPSAPPQVFHIYKLVFSGTLIDPEARPSAGSETIDAQFYPLAQLPELSLGRTLPVHIDTALRVAQDPQGLPHFD